MVRYTDGMEEPQSEKNTYSSQVSPNDQTRLDVSRYRLTIEEASQLFADAGVPRSQRTITRFCQLGDLDCLRVETEKNFKWLVDENSATKRIEGLKQALNFTKKPYQDMSSYVETISETQPDISRHDEYVKDLDHVDNENEYLRTQVEELENEVMHLRIDKAAKEQVITQLATERKDFISQMKDMSFELGQASLKLEMLEAPRPVTNASHVETDGENTTEEETQLPSGPEPERPEPIKRGFFGRLLG